MLRTRCFLALAALALKSPTAFITARPAIGLRDALGATAGCCCSAASGFRR